MSFLHVYYEFMHSAALFILSLIVASFSVYFGSVKIHCIFREEHTVCESNLKCCFGKCFLMKDEVHFCHLDSK